MSDECDSWTHKARRAWRGSRGSHALAAYSQCSSQCIGGPHHPAARGCHWQQHYFSSKGASACRQNAALDLSKSARREEDEEKPLKPVSSYSKEEMEQYLSKIFGILDANGDSVLQPDKHLVFEQVVLECTLKPGSQHPVYTLHEG